MAAYGTPDVAIAGLLYGMKADVDSAISQEDIAFGSPVFGPVGVENKAYGPHKDKATETLSADLVASNVLTTTINGIAVASTFATDHATTMTAHIAAINAKTELAALGITAAAGSSNRVVVISAPAGVDLTVSGAVTLGGTQATVAIVYGTSLKFLGVAPFIQIGGKNFGAGTSKWEALQAVNIVKQGMLWVQVESTVNDKDPAYVSGVGGAGTLGKFTDVSTNNYDIGAFFRSNVSGGLALLEVRGMK